MEKSQPITLGKQIGFGAEHSVYMIGQDLVGKIRNLFGSIWQTLAHREHDSQGAERKISIAIHKIRETVQALLRKQQIIEDGEIPFLQKCIDALDRHNIPIVPTDVLTNVDVSLNGVVSKQPILSVSQFIPNIDRKILTANDLLDPEQGPKLLPQLVEIVRKGEALYGEQLGLDPLGGEIVPDIIRASVQLAIDDCQEGLMNLFDSQKNRLFTGNADRNFLLRNVIQLPDEKGQPRLVLPDPGMHDFSDEGRYKSVTRTIHFLSFAGIIDATQRISRIHGDKGLDRETYLEVGNMHPHIPPRYRSAAKTIIDTMMPELRAA